MGVEHVDLDDLSAQLHAAWGIAEGGEGQCEVESRLSGGRKVSLIYISGNET